MAQGITSIQTDFNIKEYLIKIPSLDTDSSQIRMVTNTEEISSMASIKAVGSIKIKKRPIFMMDSGIMVNVMDKANKKQKTQSIKVGL
jgi:inosine/xanthosine triphosphate pyrophosphatase family protein